MAENAVSKFFKGLALFIVMAGIALGIMLAGDTLPNVDSGVGFILFMMSLISSVISAAFIYAIGEAIQLLEDIKQNTKPQDQSSNFLRSDNHESASSDSNVKASDQPATVVNLDNQTIRFVDGSVYKGEIVNEKPNGFGTMIYSYGNKYEGQWKDGKRHGQGTLHLAIGSIQKGYFENDAFIR